MTWPPSGRNRTGGQGQGGQSYLFTAAKWGITKLDALRSLFSGHPWMPPGLEPVPTG